MPAIDDQETRLWWCAGNGGGGVNGLVRARARRQTSSPRRSGFSEMQPRRADGPRYRWSVQATSQHDVRHRVVILDPRLRGDDGGCLRSRSRSPSPRSRTRTRTRTRTRSRSNGNEYGIRVRVRVRERVDGSRDRERARSRHQTVPAVHVGFAQRGLQAPTRVAGSYAARQIVTRSRPARFESYSA